MAHNLTIREGGTAEMFSGSGIVPWHRLGTVVPGLLTAVEAIRAAKLDWRVSKRKISVSGGGEIEGHFAVCREDNGKALGVVGERYLPIQNDEAFAFFDSVVGDGQAIYDTAGSLLGGRTVWIMAKLAGSHFIDGGEKDRIDRYVLLTNSHDGSKALFMQMVSTRVVCNNTLSVALQGATNRIAVRHTGDFNSKKTEAMRALKLTRSYFDRLEEVMDMLVSKPMDQAGMDKFAERLIPVPGGARPGTQTARRVSEQRKEIANLFAHGAGNLGKTRWDALNAATQWCDRQMPVRVEEERKMESRFASNLWGTGAALKARAFELLAA